MKHFTPLVPIQTSSSFSKYSPASFLKCFHEEVTLKTIPMLTFSVLQRKSTTYRPQGAHPIPFWPQI